MTSMTWLPREPDVQVARQTLQTPSLRWVPSLQWFASKPHRGSDELVGAGQFFPWNFFFFFFQKYSKGFYRIKKDKCGKKGLQDLWLYVNQGTGFWGPPTRLGTYGEITILELTRGEDSKPKV